MILRRCCLARRTAYLLSQKRCERSTSLCGLAVRGAPTSTEVVAGPSDPLCGDAAEARE